MASGFARRIGGALRRGRGPAAGDGPAPDLSGFYVEAAAGDGPRGELLASEPIEPPPGSPDGARAWRIRYRALDAGDRPVPATAAVAAPAADRDGSRGVVAWVHGAVGLAPGCAPSRRGLTAPGAADLLQRGMAVVAPDLVGSRADGRGYPYLHGVTAGRRVLDALRATTALPAVAPGAGAAVIGHSAGAHASLWAGQLAAGADGEGIALAAVVAAAPVADLRAAMQRYATSASYAPFVVQLAATWPAVEPVDAAEVLTTDALGRLDALGQQCLPGLMRTFGGDPARWVRAAALAEGAWEIALGQQSAGRAVGAAAAVLVHGGRDDAVPSAWTEQLAGDLEHLGGPGVEVWRYADADHNGVLEASRRDVAAFLAARLAS